MRRRMYRGKRRTRWGKCRRRWKSVKGGDGVNKKLP
jgi:hypothetical protein